LSRHSPGEFPDGTIVTLLVEDPKLTRPQRKTKPNESGHSIAKTLNVNDLHLPLNLFWDFEIRKTVLEKKISEADLQKKRSSQLNPVKTSEAKVFFYISVLVWWSTVQ
uniref:Ovule protein n=1 Tax=Gongylonema pulchrum TaxID=637853 RepID=A0A183DCA7_9BILA